MTIRWFTDADRRGMRDAAEERRVLYKLLDKYAPLRVMTAEERAEAIAHYRNPPDIGGLQINPYRRR